MEYPYSHGGKYLLAPDTPIEICLECGMIYHDGAALEEIERRFFAIYQDDEKPERYIQMPVAACARVFAEWAEYMN